MRNIFNLLTSDRHSHSAAYRACEERKVICRFRHLAHRRRRQLRNRSDPVTEFIAVHRCNCHIVALGKLFQISEMRRVVMPGSYARKSPDSLCKPIRRNGRANGAVPDSSTRFSPAAPARAMVCSEPPRNQCLEHSLQAFRQC